MAKRKTTPAKKKSTPAKKKAWDAKNYKKVGKTAGLFAVGLAAGTFADDALKGVTAIKDERLKKAIPMVAGVALAGMNNPTAQTIGIGMGVYGLVSTFRKTVGLSGADENGKGLSEETKAMLNKFIPALGEVDYPTSYASSEGYYPMEPHTVDVAHEVVENNIYQNLSGANRMVAENYFG